MTLQITLPISVIIDLEFVFQYFTKQNLGFSNPRHENIAESYLLAGLLSASVTVATATAEADGPASAPTAPEPPLLPRTHAP